MKNSADVKTITVIIEGETEEKKEELSLAGWLLLLVVSFVFLPWSLVFLIPALILGLDNTIHLSVGIINTVATLVLLAFISILALIIFSL